jgi:hypothetical protein
MAGRFYSQNSFWQKKPDWRALPAFRKDGGDAERIGTTFDDTEVVF